MRARTLIAALAWTATGVGGGTVVGGLAVVGGLTLASGCLDDDGAVVDGGDDPSLQYIANASDFDGFAAWPHAWAFPSALAGEGTVHVYANTLPAMGSRTYPKRTMLVKVIGDVGADPSTWQVHAMVKRGGDYGAVESPGWEYFDLAVVAGGHVVVQGRGEGTVAGTYVDPGDPTGDTICVSCHSAGDNDAVLSTPLQLGGP